MPGMFSPPVGTVARPSVCPRKLRAWLSVTSHAPSVGVAQEQGEPVALDVGQRRGVRQRPFDVVLKLCGGQIAAGFRQPVRIVGKLPSNGTELASGTESRVAHVGWSSGQESSAAAT